MTLRLWVFHCSDRDLLIKYDGDWKVWYDEWAVWTYIVGVAADGIQSELSSNDAAAVLKELTAAQGILFHRTKDARVDGTQIICDGMISLAHQSYFGIFGKRPLKVEELQHGLYDIASALRNGDKKGFSKLKSAFRPA